jgi:hypothetical protein
MRSSKRETPLLLFELILRDGVSSGKELGWDMKDIETRITERALMREEDIRSRKIEVFWRIIEAKRGKKKGKKGKKGKK